MQGLNSVTLIQKRIRERSHEIGTSTRLRITGPSHAIIKTIKHLEMMRIRGQMRGRKLSRTLIAKSSRQRSKAFTRQLTPWHFLTIRCSLRGTYMTATSLHPNCRTTHFMRMRLAGLLALIKMTQLSGSLARMMKSNSPNTFSHNMLKST